MAGKLLEVQNLTAGFVTEQGIAKATDRISLSVEKGKTLCIVGESGSGKSVASLSVMRLIDYAGGAIFEGSIRFNGEDLASAAQKEMIQIRGERIAMIFQDPMSALNPVFTIGDQIAESLQLHQRLSRAEAWKQAVDMLRMVGIPDPEIRAKQYPHEMSGGMRQRVVIAMALVCKPELLIADEPTTALDVTVQAQILDLLRRLQGELGMAIVLITHDMGVAAEMADRVAVMYAGKIVEEGSVEEIFDHPSHPYTIGLLRSIPGLEGERGGSLYTIPGTIPSIHHLPAGCRFHPRCGKAEEKCRHSEPSLSEVRPEHQVACWICESGSAAGTDGGKSEVNRA
ncbi:peptide ABC transporter ATP-binding protein [Paenibacillus dendritiformis]|uniref:ABC transporter ATP-binding protein n=1 Tax=Paenibacillus dendritiformis TaxID=130049 RepID=UPI0018CF0D7D|nr:ABC transporter ATP-binding protein [Paenibacillus dendritiformis]MBG9793376.1 peptide ABC transporter ATP-binding protein [Paenibacillus dendritiformis]